MPTALWPPGLPQNPVMGTLTLTPTDQREVFEPEEGPPIVRRKTDALYEAQAASVYISRAQLVAFRSFYFDTLAGGVLPFEWRDAWSDTVATFLFDPASKEPWKLQPDGGPDLLRLDMQLRRIG